MKTQDRFHDSVVELVGQIEKRVFILTQRSLASDEEAQISPREFRAAQIKELEDVMYELYYILEND